MRIIEWTTGLRGVTGTSWSGVRYVSTWRDGGVSAAPWNSLNLGLHVGDDPVAVRENRRRAGAGLPAGPLWLNQVHGTDVWPADDAAASEPVQLAAPDAVPCADAAVTTSRGRPLAIMTADCLPIVLADTAGTVLGVAHAGWRGLAAGVLESTLAAMQQRAASASDWRAWIGPGIGPEAFEVGGEVRDIFIAGDAGAASCFTPSTRTGRWLADLAGLAERRLTRAGVARIELSGECTYRQADRYFSYRRQARTGRQATFAWLV